MGFRVRLPLVALVVLVGLITSCDEGSAESVSRDHGIAILSSEVGPPGTVIGDGLRVPRGAVLAGVAVPTSETALVYRGQPIRARAWLARLGVGGSPTAVARRLLAQAHRASYAALPDDVSCSGDGSVTGDGSTATTLAPGESRPITTTESSQCWFTTAPGPPTGRRLDVTVSRQPELGTWGVITFTDWGGEEPNEVDTPGGGPTATPVPARSAAPTGFPSVGDRFTVGGEGFVVAEGSALVLPHLPVDGANGEALLAVTGDAARVFASYASQVRRNLDAEHGPPHSDDGSTRIVERRERRGAWRVHLIQGDDGAPDGRYESVELLTRRDTAYVRIFVTNG